MNKQITKKIQQKYKISNSRGIEKFFNENPDIENFCKELLNKISWFQNTKNVFIAISHNIFDIVLCKTCKKPLKVEKAIYGRNHYCCKKCADNNKQKILKQKQTCLKKYGTVSPLLNEKCKQKTKQTCQKKFGNDMFAGSNEYKKRIKSPFLLQKNHMKSKETKINKYGQNYGKVIFEKNKDVIQKRNIKKYGVPYLLMNDDILSKTHETMEKKYGSDNFFSSNKCLKLKLSRAWKRIQKWKNHIIPLFTFQEYEGYNKIYKWKCVKCGNIFEQKIYTTGLGESRTIPRCQICYPNHASSIVEKELLNFIKSIYQGKIIRSNKEIIKPYELDIYLPEKQVAIQFDGIYWHNNKHKSENYHLNKTESCEEQGIHLIHIFQDEWLCKQDIVKDRIKYLLGIYDKKIYARKCIVKEIDSKTSNKFLEQNHLQGKDNAKIRYGLFYENELVSVMTFGKPRFNKNFNYELLRFASNIGYKVVGGASKLLNAFQRQYRGSIISYADRRYSNGKLYEAIGFELIGKSQPNYFYVKGTQKLSRYQCQKNKLKKLLDNFDEKLSENENMQLNGYNKIYDCGNLVYIL